MPPAELAALRRAIGGTVVTPEDPEDEADALPPMASRDAAVRPQAVVACRSAGDVAEAIAVARRAAVPLAPRSGGHCFASRSTTRGMVVDVGPMDAVDVDGGLVRVGAGVRLGALYDALAAHHLTLPAGCGSTVGIAGLTLGGGFGILGRTHGLTCDSLVAARVVLADGRILHCDDEHHPELFWALRGAGGGQFAVVTSLTFRPVPAPSASTISLRWSQAHAAAAIDGWQRWAPAAPGHVDATLRVAAPGDHERPLTVELVVAVTGVRQDPSVLLGELVALVGADPEQATQHHGPYRDVKRRLAGLDADEPAGAVPGLQATKSEFFRRPLPAEAISALVARMGADRAARQARELTFIPWGGAYNRPAEQATAFAHREERFLLEHTVLAPAGALGAARDWVRSSWAIARPWGTGRAYPNFPDPDLEDWRWAYHGRNHARLQRIKRRYDPDGTFGFHQGL